MGLNDWTVKKMDWEEAVGYCATHECFECPAFNSPDHRTEYEKTDLHVPCCVNLVIGETLPDGRRENLFRSYQIGSELIASLNEALAHKQGEIILPNKTLSNDGLIDRAEILRHRCKVAVEAFENYDDFQNCDYVYVVPVKYILEAEKVEPKTGYWVIGDPDNGESDLICGECGKELDFEVAGGDMLYWLESEYKFCPCCGTRMFIDPKSIARNAN